MLLNRRAVRGRREAELLDAGVLEKVGALLEVDVVLRVQQRTAERLAPRRLPVARRLLDLLEEALRERMVDLCGNQYPFDARARA